MKLQRLLLAAAAIASLRASAASPHPSLPQVGTLDGLGVNIHFTDPQPGEMEMIAAAGFKWVRNDLTWGATEREKGKYDYAAYDRLVSALEAQKMHALFILDYGNRLYDDGLSPHTDEGRAAFAKWAVATVSHFKGKGCVWELWNEPNGDFWKPRASVEEYIALARATGKALRDAGLIRSSTDAAAPTAATEAYIGPATSTIDMGYLEACFKAGLLDYWDAVSVHPYRQKEPERAEEEYRKLRFLIHRYAPEGKAVPIISGEWGYSTAWKEIDEEKQAKYLARELLTNVANDIPISIWYDWREDGDDPHDAEHHFGIVHRKYLAGHDPVFEPKPAYLAARELFNQLSGLHFSKKLGDESSSRTLLFEGRGEYRLVKWQVPFAPGDVDTAPTYTAPQTPAAKRSLQVLSGWSRLPLEYTVGIPAEFPVLAGLHNTLDESLALDLSVSRVSPSGGSPAQSASSAGFAVQLMPDASLEKAEAMRYDPEQPKARVVEMLRFAGDGATYVQSAPIIAGNALEANLLPPNETVQPVLVKNPSGQPFDGVIKLDFTRGGQAGEASDQLTFNKGETEKIALLSLGASGTEAHLLRIETLLPELVYSTPAEALQMIDGFTAAHLRVAPDGDAKVLGEATLSDGLPSGEIPSIVQTTAVKVAYRFGAGWRFLQLRLEPPAPVFSKPPKSLGIWVFGDDHACIPRLRIADASGQIFQADGPKIDWKGWRYITIPMQSPPEHPLAHWGGSNDGQIHAPAKWDCLFLLDNSSRKAFESEIWLSAPTLCY